MSVSEMPQRCFSNHSRQNLTEGISWRIFIGVLCDIKTAFVALFLFINDIQNSSINSSTYEVWGSRGEEEG